MVASEGGDVDSTWINIITSKCHKLQINNEMSHIIISIYQYSHFNFEPSYSISQKFTEVRL